MSGTDAVLWTYVMPSTGVVCDAIGVRGCYAVPGTDAGYDATSVCASSGHARCAPLPATPFAALPAMLLATLCATLPATRPATPSTTVGAPTVWQHVLRHLLRSTFAIYDAMPLHTHYAMPGTELGSAGTRRMLLCDGCDKGFHLKCLV
eukprot:541467-Rhodomonas_salina.3